MSSVVWSIVLFASVGASIWLAHWMAPERVVGVECRPSDPQAGSADGTGVEHGALRLAVADLAVLPRSPMASVGAGDPRRPAPTGLQRKRVVLNG